MPDDEITKQLLSDYVATAENLQKGVNVSTETLNRYHGMTGMLLAHTVENLWTQQDLDAQIEKKHQEMCEACKRRSAESSAVPSTLWALVCTNFRLIFICVTVMVSLAIAFNQLPALRDFFRSAKTEAVARLTEEKK